MVYAEENGKSEEELIRALMLSHLTVIYIKQSLGRLSALCGCVVAATGSSCGITWLMGGTYEQVAYACLLYTSDIPIYNRRGCGCRWAALHGPYAQ